MIFEHFDIWDIILEKLKTEDVYCMCVAAPVLLKFLPGLEERCRQYKDEMLP